MNTLCQAAIDRAVAMATRAALRGHPVERIVWIPAQSPTGDPMGGFVIQEYTGGSASQLPPWELG